METDNKTQKEVHHGRNLKRLREAKGIKQDAMAQLINLTQSSVARIEGKKTIDDNTLKKFADALSIPVEIIKQLEEDPAKVIIENNFFDIENIESGGIGFNNNRDDYSQNTYNPVEKVIELCNEKVALYERMLALEKEKTEMLEKLLKEKKK